MASAQKPLELILARNFLSSLATPAFLVDTPGTLIYFNDAAGALLGKRFEETGPMTAAEWGAEFGPFTDDGTPIPLEKLPVTSALRDGRPVVSAFTIRASDETEHQIEVSALPIVASDQSKGAIVFFWPVGNGG
jgi:PAS domain-containing protein